jgi:predicted nucleic-acid-binding protein
MSSSHTDLEFEDIIQRSKERAAYELVLLLVDTQSYTQRQQCAKEVVENIMTAVLFQIEAKQSKLISALIHNNETK